MREKVEEQLKRYLEELDEQGGLPFNELTVAEAREADDDFLRDMWEKMPESQLKSIDDMEAEETGLRVPIRVYTPLGDAASFPVILFIHGGGWVLGSIENRDKSCREIAVETGACVVSIGYRLAPEHPYPAAPDDCYAAALWVWNNAEALGWDRSSFLVMGDSAGGNLAAVAANRAAELGEPVITGQVLIYPVTNLASTDSSSYLEFSEEHLLTRDSMEWLIEKYIPDPGVRMEPEASPLHAAFDKLPAEAYLITAECDVLRDEGEAYAEKLRESGVKTKLSRFGGMLHGFFDMPSVSQEAARARREISRNIKNLL